MSNLQIHLRTDKTIIRIGITAVTALLGGFAFTLLHIPIPWLLGPMLAVLIGSNMWGSCQWPGGVRNTGLIIVGYTIGLSLTVTALEEMGHQLPVMLLMTVLLLLLCAGIAFFVAKLSGNDYMTVLMGSIPGGLTQMIALAEETKGINITVVTVIQVVRLMMIVVFVPLLIFSPLLGFSADGGAQPPAAQAVAVDWGGLFPNGLLFAAVCTGCALVGNRIRLPTPYLLGPAIGAAVLQMTGLDGPELPAALLSAAQLMIGTYVGLLLKPDQLPNKLRTIALAVGSGLLLLVGAWGFSVLLLRFHPVSMATSLLSMAPGGMDQMGIIAHVIDADLSTVAGYQLFRLLFIFFAVPPILRLVIRFLYIKNKS